MTISTLVVDDNANTRADIASSLSHLDINLVFANDGLDGLKQAKEGVFDLMIVDHKMPLMDGLTLLKNLRQLEHYHYTPILFVTTQDVTEIEPIALKNGATRCLSKPLESEFLSDVVTYYTKRSVA
ncbi:two-component system chemotaxis response regulator CheY [Idiomarina fontislapidosi]|uniref:Two-component system response regulator n=1 Tax=Idiomarina fontislapidosi TaxID=263723 RepID=A0A432XX05_9GAMM|nr:response regulator [Idiomarina fontislapidosi]PYE32033.1 two-component system chemotaxis response regulator CheY [Idiomarina fontislapidosi]RUO53239.1 two-component system response regulator [Idiomarina fontislapidosi]|tara:strand:+ start:1573 stop:1950 length:378 start_codon:yes stop_codon:yes gene_type:complete